MTPDLLIKHFDRVSEAPDAIPNLRSFILDLAVRGKLVPQDPSDEPVLQEGPVNENVTEILKETTVKHSSQMRFAIPPTWAWIPLANAGISRLGKMLDKAKNKGIPKRYLRNTNVRWFDFDLSDVNEMRFEESELEEFSLFRGDVLICEGGEPGRAAVWDGRETDIYFQKAIHRVRLSRGINAHYFVNVLRQSADSGRLAAYFTGVGIKHLTGKGLAAFLLPVPPLAEQNRIVAKLDELMMLCDQFALAQAERERRRNIVVAASNHHLLHPAGPEAFRHHAKYYLSNLPSLTNRRCDIERLRETIRTLAVHGHLVVQDDEEESSIDLLRRIAARKRKLVEEGVIKNLKPSPPLTNDDVPFLTPTSWQWVRLSDITDVQDPNPSHRMPHYVDVGGIPFISSENFVENDLIDFTIGKRVTRETLDEQITRFPILAGAVAFTRIGTIGKSRFLPEERSYAISHAVCVINPLDMSCLSMEFLRLAMTVEAILAFAHRGTRSIGVPDLGMAVIRRMAIPLPPLNEQYRIMAKVDALMELCDGLETRITGDQNNAQRLLDALLDRALEGNAVEQISGQTNGRGVL